MCKKILCWCVALLTIFSLATFSTDGALIEQGESLEKIKSNITMHPGLAPRVHGSLILFVTYHTIFRRC